MDLTQPINIKELQTLLGMITFLSPYIPRLSESTAPLRKLLHKDSVFKWNHEHTQAFRQLKDKICSATTLAYFDPNKQTILQVGPNAKWTSNPSKSLTEMESRYANIKRELLACVFEAERFHTYLFGKPFTRETDHRPLEMISKKSLSAVPL